MHARMMVLSFSAIGRIPDMGGCMDWYYGDNGTRVGPLSETEFRERVTSGVITKDTLIWNERISKWRTYGEVFGTPSPAEQSTPSTTDPCPEDKPNEPHYRCTQCDREYPRSRMKVTVDGFTCNQCFEAVNEPPVAAPRQLGDSYASPTRQTIEFTGTGQEYFRIWIVNLLLTIVTCGIYSAWAKVRRNQYFYRHTSIAGSSFDYHGNPKAILKGRIIAFIILAALSFSPKINPALYALVLLFVIAAVPWFLVRSFSFRLYNSSWRGIRFHFHGTVAKAVEVFYINGVLVILSLGLCYPLLYHRMRMFIMNNAAFGTTRFKTDVATGDVYSVFIRTIGLAIVLIFVLGITFAIVSGVLGVTTGAMGGHKAQAVIIVLFAIMSVIFYGLFRLFIQTFVQARMNNLFWSNTSLDSAMFDSTMSAMRLAGIWAKNATLTFLTLGFYWPWAKVRIMRYRAETLTLITPRGIEDFIADTSEKVTAAGEEITDALDFDIGF